MAICTADYLPRFRPDHRKTDNAIVVRVDQRFQKSPRPGQRFSQRLEHSMMLMLHTANTERAVSQSAFGSSTQDDAAARRERN